MQPPDPSSATDPFLRGGGEMGERVRRHDWAGTALGPPSRWPASLRNAVSLLLNCQLPMYLAWGPQLLQVYNDAYRPILGDKHPAALGASARTTWQEIWPTVGPMWQRVLQGQPIGFDDFQLTIERYGYPEDCHFNFSYSPVLGDGGDIEGVLVTFAETTARVRSERRLTFLDDLSQATRSLSDPAEVMRVTAEALGRHLGANRCAYAHVLEDGNTFDVIGDYSDGVASMVGRYRFTDFGRAVHQLMLRGEPFVNHDVDHDPATRGTDLAAYRATGIQAVICVPLQKEGRFVAGMAVHQSTPRRWTQDEVELVATVVDRCWEVLERLRDANERRAAQQAEAQSAEQFRLFAQSLPNHVWTSPASGKLDWFNDRVYEYSGAARGSLDGDGWARTVHPDDRPAAAERWAHSLRTGADFETEFRIRRADGEYRWHLVRALPLRSADGQALRWIGTNTDVHESRLQHVATARDRDRIWALSQELMLVCDVAGTITAVNPAATRILGWPAGVMVGRPLSDFLHPDDQATTAGEVDKLSGGHPTLAFENRWRTHDGEHRLLSWTAVPEGGYIHAVARDVTRERATEDALRQSQKLEAIGQLTGGVAHDFNNVLAVIRTSIDLLRRVDLPQDRRGRLMESISNSVTRATKLTGQLLAFARRQALQPVVFDAAQNTRAVGDMIASLAGARIDIAFDLPPHQCFVYADPSQFDTALVNLAVNARDAMDGQGRLTIRVVPADGGGQGGLVAISMSDTGCGIAPEHLKRIFEPFFTTKTDGHGTGLGLSQVFGFAKQSGGDIDVHSELGRGATFTLYLPRAEPPALAGEAPPSATRWRWARAPASSSSRTTSRSRNRCSRRCRRWVMHRWSPTAPSRRCRRWSASPAASARCSPTW
ncbi:PAS domain-containing protein [Aquabacterium sp. J223]|uniref:PAS domain-containing protein n=1 Tax=Aquabacterium sp. J223 TaxID=2898431 RepID=UPI0021AD51F8|nr:PAS domain-containing protein [Aquabacterium sp. J223]UUX97229.1 PAS domain-containing protein [Aquabacterium sp. J223]